jgi:hypothetical protein
VQREGEAVKTTQGDTVIAALKRKPHTYAEMLAIPGGGCCCWKRAAEAIEQPRNHGWEIKIGRRWVAGHDYLTTWQVVKVKR